MPTSKVLTEFYLIAEELDKNILLFNELEKKLEEAKKNNDMALADKLLRKYKEVSDNIKDLKERSKKLKDLED